MLQIEKYRVYKLIRIDDNLILGGYGGAKSNYCFLLDIANYNIIHRLATIDI